MGVRQATISALEDCKVADQMIRYEHRRNYWCLHVDPDGDLSWIERESADTANANGYLLRKGTGSTPCNCDACQLGDPDWTIDDYHIDAEAYIVANDEIAAAIGGLARGYFADEKL